MNHPSVGEVDLDRLPWQQLQSLLDVCYPRPPRDVFEKVVAFSHRRQRVWVATDGSNVLGMVMLSPHSKGGHLENLAVEPQARGLGVGHKLVEVLLQSVAMEGPSMVTITTRIPAFFSPFGFQSCGQLADGSKAMLIIL
jgi:ribosomal protein S18 acetylase RimI-like enzyme